MFIECPANKDDEKWMTLALQLAELASEKNEVPVGAVVVQDRTVIASAHNQTIGSCDPSAHAEIGAIRAASLALGNYRLPNTTLYVSLEPCAMCLGAIVQARVARVVFGAPEPKAGVLVSHPLTVPFNHHCEFSRGVLMGESQQLLQTFFQRRRKMKRALKDSG